MSESRFLCVFLFEQKNKQWIVHNTVTYNNMQGSR